MKTKCRFYIKNDNNWFMGLPFIEKEISVIPRAGEFIQLNFSIIKNKIKEINDSNLLRTIVGGYSNYWYGKYYIVKPDTITHNEFTDLLNIVIENFDDDSVLNFDDVIFVNEVTHDIENDMVYISCSAEENKHNN